MPGPDPHPGQPMLEGMPRRLYAATPARLATYLDCPRRYRFAYLQRPAPAKGPPWAHNSVGAAVHGALARWWRLPRERRTPSAGGALLVGGWLADGFRDRVQSDRARERARAQVERYLAGVDADREPVTVEGVVTLRTPRAVLWGRVDRVDDRGEELVVVDYKTGRSVPTVDDARTSAALAVYAAATAETLHRRCRRVELHHVPSGTLAAWDHTEESLQQHVGAAEALTAELGLLEERYRGLADSPDGDGPEQADELFPAYVAARCGWCDFQAACRPGRAVPKQPSWAGLADPG